MTNYAATTVPGTSRRRAKDIIIHNPAKAMNNSNIPPEVPMITFIMEDRIIMADGNETLIPAGELTLKLDAKVLSKQFPSIDTATGEVDNTKMRYGYQLMSMIIDALEDVFISSSMERDKELSTPVVPKEPESFPDAVAPEPNTTPIEENTDE